MDENNFIQRGQTHAPHASGRKIGSFRTSTGQLIWQDSSHQGQESECNDKKKEIDERALESKASGVHYSPSQKEIGTMACSTKCRVWRTQV